MSKGILQVHPPICDCPGCRISSPVNRGRLADKRTVALPPARVLKKERTPSFCTSDGDSDGSGPAYGRRPGLKQEDDPHVRIMKRRVHTHWDVNISFRETSCSQDGNPTLISSGSCSFEEPQWPGSPPALVPSRSPPQAGPGSAPGGHRPSCCPVLLREGAAAAAPPAVAPEHPSHRPWSPSQAPLFGGTLSSVPDPRLRLPAPRPGGDVCSAAGAPAEAEPGPAGAVRRLAAAEGARERAAAAAGAGGRPAPRRGRGAAAARAHAGAETQRGAAAGPAPPGPPGARAPHPAPGACLPSPPERGPQLCLHPAQRVQGDNRGGGLGTRWFRGRAPQRLRRRRPRDGQCRGPGPPHPRPSPSWTGQCRGEGASLSVHAAPGLPLCRQPLLPRRWAPPALDPSLGYRRETRAARSPGEDLGGEGPVGESSSKSGAQHL
uniref:Sterile alpha motif domain containing 11 n=1 Tax=Prolemur simus TaxID=1328070 RepID=A0A8C8ZFS7_PROSS